MNLKKKTLGPPKKPAISNCVAKEGHSWDRRGVCRFCGSIRRYSVDEKPSKGPNEQAYIDSLIDTKKFLFKFGPYELTIKAKDKKEAVRCVHSILFWLSDGSGGSYYVIAQPPDARIVGHCLRWGDLKSIDFERMVKEVK